MQFQEHWLSSASLPDLIFTVIAQAFFGSGGPGSRSGEDPSLLGVIGPSTGIAAQQNPGMFRFTKIWEKIIVIIGVKWSDSIVIGQDGVEPKLA
jgi:hypothetical protein